MSKCHGAQEVVVQCVFWERIGLVIYINAAPSFNDAPHAQSLRTGIELCILPSLTPLGLL
jgi:hypothetical protein